MKNKIQLLIASLFVFGFVAVMNATKAQTLTDNTIEEVRISKSDAFNDIRSRLMDNFDFTNGDYKEGIVNSIVKFDISEKGKIINVHSSGDCKNVSKEIETVLSGLNYKADRSKFGEDLAAYTYVMPVTVEIDR